jgi:hypothetical protein
MGFSLIQLQAYSNLAAKQRRVELAEFCGAVRVAFGADADEFAKQLSQWLK